MKSRIQFYFDHLLIATCVTFVVHSIMPESCKAGHKRQNNDAAESPHPPIKRLKTMSAPHDGHNSRSQSEKRKRLEHTERLGDLGPPPPTEQKEQRGHNQNDPQQPHHPPESLRAEIRRPESLQQSSTVPAAHAQIQAQPLFPEVHHLASKYDFFPTSILSSAKIEQKVKNLLERVGHFSFADPKAKPGVVILHAKAPVVSKLASIVEIAKGVIEKERGKWWQYSKLEGQLAELKKKPVKRAEGGKTLTEWDKEQTGNGPVEAKMDVQMSNVVQEGQREKEIADLDEDRGSDEGFERMATPKPGITTTTTQDHEASMKVRNIPVVTIYFARVPVPGLKELYG